MTARNPWPGLRDECVTGEPAGEDARPTPADSHSPPILNRSPARTFAPSAG
jgi:hypothetical protein